MRKVEWNLSRSQRECGTEALARSHDERRERASLLRCVSILQLSWLGEAHEALCAPRTRTQKRHFSLSPHALALAQAGAERVQKGAKSACTEPFDVPARRARVCASSKTRGSEQPAKQQASRRGRGEREGASCMHAYFLALASRLGLAAAFLCWSRAAACLQLDSAKARPK